MSMSKKLGAEFIGTFWLVLGGCGSAVLAAMGMEGLCLRTPLLVPAESAESKLKFIRLILTNRRDLLGGQAAPCGYSTDNIRSDYNMLEGVTDDVFPELAAAKSSTDKAVLMVQDLQHLLWHFTE